MSVTAAIHAWAVAARGKSLRAVIGSPSADAGPLARRRTARKRAPAVWGAAHAKKRSRSWSGIVALGLAVLALLLVALPAEAQIQRSFRNLGFEAPPTFDVPPNCFLITRIEDAPGWATTEPVQTNGGAGGCPQGNPGTGAGTIEIWNTAFSGVSAAEGSQFAELNAYSNGRLSQPVCLFNNEQVGYSMLHRGRGSSTVADVAEFNIDGAGNTVVRVSTTNVGNDSNSGTVACGGTMFSAAQTNTVSGATDGLVQSASCSTSASTNGWRRYNGTFVYGGANGTHNFGFGAISTGSGGTSVGNFLDSVDIILNPVVEFTGSIAGTRREGAAANTLSPQIRIVGTVPAGGLVLDFENAATATATQGTDYTINSVTIPAGRYEVPTTLTLTNLVTVNNDTIIENNETIDLRIVARQGAYVVGSTQTCGNNAATPGVVTIIDNDVDLATTKTVANANPAPGGSAVFTVTYRNNTARPTVGTGTDLNAHDATATLADALPAGFTAFSWTCAGTGGATCPAATGTGAINATPVTLAAGSNGAAGATLTYTVTGTVAAGQCAATVNTSTITVVTPLAEATGAQADFTTPNPGGSDNNTASVTVDPGCLTLNKTTQSGVGGPFNFTLTNTTQTTGTATTVTAGAAQQVDGNGAAGLQPFGVSTADTAITIGETALPANFVLTDAACVNNGSTVGSLTGTTYTIPAGSVTAGADFVCTFTNTRSTTLQLAKTWATGSLTGNQVTIGATTGGTNNTVSFDATAPTAANSGTAVTVAVGNAITLPAEGGTDVANYTTTVACTGNHTLSGTNGQQTNTLTITSGNAAVCTYTNTPRTTTLQLSKAWATGSVTGNQVTIGATTGGTNNTASFNATAPTAANSGAAVAVTIGNTITLPAEGGTDVANYTTTVACTGNHTLSGTNGQQTNTLTITSTNPAECTYTNTPRTTTLQLAKAWATGSVTGNQVTIGATTGGTNNTASFNATAPTAANSGAAVDVTVGNVITLPAETGADVANYTTTVACTGNHTLSGTNGQQANTLTITSTNPAECTYTNTPRTTTLQLSKAWATGSVTGNQVTIGATTGGTNNTASFNATAPTAANSGAAVDVTFGNTITLPAETGTDVANYTTTVACTGNHTLSGTDGQQANTLTITSANPATCTYTNTPRTTTLQLSKAWAAGSVTGNQVTIGATTGGTNNTASFNATAPTAANSGAAVDVTIGNVITLPAETGTDVANYTTTVACTGNHTLSGTDGQQANTLTITSANPATCTYTNTPRTTTLQLSKAWAAGSVTGNQVTIGATTGGTNNTASFNATAPTAANSGAAVVVTVGNTITLPAEGGTDVANYTTTVACTGNHTLSGTDGQQANTLTITSTNAAECTYTNTPRTTTLTLRKQWSGATVGDNATVSVSRGGAAVGTLDSRADTSNEVDASATPVTVFAGETLTLQEALAGANTGQYDSALACTGAADTDPDDGLTIAAGDGAIVCTFTNTQRTTDLSITKTNTPASGASDQTGDTVVGGTDTTYSVVVTNHAATAVTGAVVRDTPQAGLDCPAANAVTCAGAACPSGAITVGDLANGVTLGQLAAGATATLSFTCAVQR
ncbi:hypothetical protein J5226_18655 [Lysobacter sp. K5869]|uniref:beta strand repeat-containing protein n=1 Tax=Lysobacter sp. K5869 TaxID=2820808 RepID=UPI001C061094|nr:DUF11 domain-containing protein [Lysobacter sp. K5869]QWP75615.1 hypothetical protein J5226_18655 [Lysobacter sp. K5869]